MPELYLDQQTLANLRTFKQKDWILTIEDLLDDGKINLNITFSDDRISQRIRQLFLYVTTYELSEFDFRDACVTLLKAYFNRTDEEAIKKSYFIIVALGEVKVSSYFEEVATLLISTDLNNPQHVYKAEYDHIPLVYFLLDTIITFDLDDRLYNYFESKVDRICDPYYYRAMITRIREKSDLIKFVRFNDRTLITLKNDFQVDSEDAKPILKSLAHAFNEVIFYRRSYEYPFEWLKSWVEAGQDRTQTIFKNFVQYIHEELEDYQDYDVYAMHFQFYLYLEYLLEMLEIPFEHSVLQDRTELFNREREKWPLLSELNKDVHLWFWRREPYYIAMKKIDIIYPNTTEHEKGCIDIIKKELRSNADSTKLAM